MVSTERRKEILQFSKDHGEIATLSKYKISADTYKRYVRASQGWERSLVLSDVHLEYGSPVAESYKLLKKWAENKYFRYVYLNGDILDFSYISSFNKDALQLLEGKRIYKDYMILKQEIAFWQARCEKVIFLIGNHEQRIYKAVEKGPWLEGMIEPEIRFPDLEIIQIADQPYKYGKLHILHGVYAGINPVKKHLDAFGHNVLFGHTHHKGYYEKDLPLQNQTIAAWNVGCLCGKSADYLKGRPSGWAEGFAVIDMHTSGDFRVWPVDIINSMIYFEGEETR